MFDSASIQFASRAGMAFAFVVASVLVSSCTSRRVPLGAVHDGGRQGVAPPLRDAGPRGFDAGPATSDAGRLPHDGASAMDDGGATGATGSCSDSPCRLVAAQCGCGDVETEACDLELGVRVCRSAGTREEGEACTTSQPCRAGLTCVGPTAGTHWCVRYCVTDSDCDGSGSLCVGQLTENGSPIAGAKVCSENCDPVGGLGCPTGYGCTVFREPSGSMRFYTGCRIAGSAGDGASCVTEDDCQSGFRCLGFTCQAWCDLDTSRGCSFSETCSATSVSVLAGSTNYGTCQ